MWVGVSAQKVGVDALRSTDPAAGRRGPLRGPVPPGRQLLLRHLLPGRPGHPRQRRRTVLGGLRPEHVHRGGRVAVGRPPGDLHQRGPSARRTSTTASSCTAAAAAAPRCRRHRSPTVHGAVADARSATTSACRSWSFQTETDVVRHSTARQPDTRPLPAVGGGRHRALRLLRARASARPTSATVRARSSVARHRCSNPTNQPNAELHLQRRRSTPGPPLRAATRPSTGSTGGCRKASCRRWHPASRPSGRVR